MFVILTNQQWHTHTYAKEVNNVGSQDVLGEVAQSTYNYIKRGIAEVLCTYVSSSSQQR